jgi:hypothetical protein
MLYIYVFDLFGTMHLVLSCPSAVLGSVLVLLLSILPAGVSASPQTQVTTITRTAALSTPSASLEYVSDSAFTSAILNSTNTYRVQHSAPELSYNNTLSRFAAEYLSSVKNSCTFAHSGGPYGENLALGYPDIVASIDAWGNERRNYNFDKPGFGEETGHFTQLVWKNTTTVGCGRVDCGEGKGWYLACEYWPRGNVVGAFGEMVGRPIRGVDMGSGGVVSRAESWRLGSVVAVAVLSLL